MTEDQMREIARGNIEQNLSDAIAEDCADLGEYAAEAVADAIYDSAYILGFDALHDKGVDNETARRIASEVAQCFAQP